MTRDVPPPAPTSLHCWLWAAYPWRTPDGDLDLDRIGEHLGLPAQDLAQLGTRDTKVAGALDTTALYRRAILRGRGIPSWPDLDEGSLAREATRTAYAVRAHRRIIEEPDKVPEAWKRAGHLLPNTVVAVWWPSAHVFGVSAVSAKASMAKLLQHAEVLHTAEAPNRFAARIMKGAVLRRAQARCVTPVDLVPIGRTETWRERMVRPIALELDGEKFELELTNEEHRILRRTLAPWQRAARQLVPLQVNGRSHTLALDGAGLRQLRTMLRELQDSPAVVSRDVARPQARIRRGPVRIPSLKQALQDITQDATLPL